MSTGRIDDPDNMFDSHSLSASLEDFEQHERPPSRFNLPSQHSGFKSDDSEAELDSNSVDPWSPQSFRRPDTSNGWYRHKPYLHESRSSKSPSKSREASPQYEDAMEDEDFTLAANIPLPRGSLSPEKQGSPSPQTFPEGGPDFAQEFGQPAEAPVTPENPNNYIRFAMRAEVQQKTEPFELAFSWFRTSINRITKSRLSLGSSITVALISFFLLRLLFQPPVEPPLPDLVKIAGFARSFEPLIYYSESGVRQIGDLQETGVAVWDLSESVRAANMTSAPVIVSELDDLGDSLKKLSIELTKFFANVDGDIDGILIVMDWAKRELAALPTLPPNSLSSAFTNIHSLLTRLGVLENPSTGLPTQMGTLLTELFGATPTQRTRKTLQRTFLELISVLEESINSEILYATALFSLFATIDRQFLNLQRTTIREYDTQERQEADFLSSLWTRVLGPNAALVRTYEKNKDLLRSVRERTLSNKNLLEEHNGKLMMLQQNLETLRRRLVSPLVSGGEGSSIGVEEQIRGLEGTYEHLKRVREKQKERVMETMYGEGSKRAGVRRIGIDGR